MDDWFYDALSINLDHIYLTAWSGYTHVIEPLFGGAMFSLSPASGMVEPGGSVDVTVSYNTAGRSKGEYDRMLTLYSNDVNNPAAGITQVIRVVGAPGVTLADDYDSDGNTWDEEGNISHVAMGELPFLESASQPLHFMNYDSNTVSISMSLADGQNNSMYSLAGTELSLAPYTSGVLEVVIDAPLDEMNAYTDVLVATSHSGMESHVVSFNTDIIPSNASVITLIQDVGPDQGGRVTVEFTRSYFDGIEDSSRTEMYTVQLNNEGNWTSSNSTVAYENERYYALVHTLQDSGALGDGMTEFRVVAGMDEGTFISESAYGYSTDDIAPASPMNLAAAQSGNHIALNWEHGDDDYYHFSVYRHTNPEFEPGPDSHIGDAMEMTFVDTTAEWFVAQYYMITAIDYGGNVSDPSEVAEGYVHVNFAPELTTIEAQSMDEDQSLRTCCYCNRSE